MKILYIITQADGGGAQQYVLMMAKHFGGSIAAGNEANQLFAAAKALGITTYELKNLKRNIHLWHDIAAIDEIYTLVKKTRPDIVHLNSTKAGFLGSIGAKLAGAKVLFTAHGFRYSEPLSGPARLFSIAIEKFASLFRDYIITVSESDLHSAQEHTLIHPNKISTIHNGIAHINFLSADEAQKKLVAPKGKIIFGCVANFYKTKGLDVLVQAISLLPEHDQVQCHFILIGDGPELKNLKLKIENLKLNDYITLSGKIPNAEKLLKAFDCLILPSRKEGFPFILLEALQAGLPIITTDVGGNNEAIGNSGILVQPEDPSALEGAILSLIHNPSKRTELAALALTQSENFTDQKMFEQSAKIYNQLLT